MISRHPLRQADSWAAGRAEGGRADRRTGGQADRQTDRRTDGGRPFVGVRSARVRARVIAAMSLRLLFKATRASPARQKARPLNADTFRHMRLKNYALGHWVEGTGAGTDLFHAVTGDKIVEAGSGGLDFKAMTEFARTVGGPKLRRMTFHQRALMLKEMAKYLGERKEPLYALSAATGATRTDSWVDIDGGIGTFFVYASKGRRDRKTHRILNAANARVDGRGRGS